MGKEVRSMSQSVKIMLTGRHESTVKNAMKTVITKIGQGDSTLTVKPVKESVNWPKGWAQIIGCRGTDLTRMSIKVNIGDDKVRKIMHAELPFGVTLEYKK